MQVKFLLGPAGSGKTFRCLAEIRTALENPEGLPLVFLAPKQATFQLERELLSDPGLPGFTRLQIVAFDTLAELVLGHFFPARPKLLREEGRVMVLRALLIQKYTELKLFHATARLPGFARQLNALLNELQQHQVVPEQLLQLAAQAQSVPQLPEKLHDLALLLRAYLHWLDRNELQDPGRLLDLAAAEIQRAARADRFHLGGLWLDGFAELTPQELNFLAALIPACQSATLAFCLEPGSEAGLSPYSIWTGTNNSFQRCRQWLERLPASSLSLHWLNRNPAQSRFARNPALNHLERHWTDPRPFPGPQPPIPESPSSAGATSAPVQIFKCPNPEAEAIVAAREILFHVRERKGRYREIGVLVRSLEQYAHVIHRIFTRYGIPFFLDRRQPVAHHPLAELTRYALRLVIFGWQHDDWFGALKTGLVHADPARVDELENAALAHGWRGDTWLSPLQLPKEPELEQRLEQLRRSIVPPFQRLITAFDHVLRIPTGAQLAAAIRVLWQELEVTQTLREWTATPGSSKASMVQAQVHAAALEELDRWLDNLELAFATTALPIGDWLQVLEAGLSHLTVGVIPLALDEVLVGAVDRSRNPNLDLVLVLGVNETFFPLAPPPAVLLTDPDRDALLALGLALDAGPVQHVAHEGFLGYVAATRARQRLVLTYAVRDQNEVALNPSPFIDHLQRLFPGLAPQALPAEPDWRQSIHPVELLAPMIRNRLKPAEQVCRTLARLESLPQFQPVLARTLQLSGARAVDHLAPGLPQRLFGPALDTSISHLEDYAACPFKFFVARGLKAQERQEFEIDPRERGSFQHEVLMEFHRRLRAQGKRWRDISPTEARDFVAQVGEDVRQQFRGGLFDISPERRFTARALIGRLQTCVETLVRWAPQYAFEPWAVELGFGLDQTCLPPWRIELDSGAVLALRGRIDRVDVLPHGPDEAYVVVIDYKSSGQELKPVKVEHGLDLQLLAYLGVLQETRSAQALLGSPALIPAGAFYVSLRGNCGAAKNRAEVLAEGDQARRRGYQHRGRFRYDLLRQFDNRQTFKGDQFRFALKQDGDLSERNTEAISAEEFLALVANTRDRLAQYGREIFQGTVRIDPYRINTETACAHCYYASICRFDPWLEPYRVLRLTRPRRSAPVDPCP